MYHIYASQYQNFDFKLRWDCRRNFLWAPCLWACRRWYLRLNLEKIWKKEFLQLCGKWKRFEPTWPTIPLMNMICFNIFYLGKGGYKYINYIYIYLLNRNYFGLECNDNLINSTWILKHLLYLLLTKYYNILLLIQIYFSSLFCTQNLNKISPNNTLMKGNLNSQISILQDLQIS